jgi:hypothetical protein
LSPPSERVKRISEPNMPPFYRGELFRHKAIVKRPKPW